MTSAFGDADVHRRNERRHTIDKAEPQRQHIRLDAIDRDTALAREVVRFVRNEAAQTLFQRCALGGNHC